MMLHSVWRHMWMEVAVRLSHLQPRAWRVAGGVCVSQDQRHCAQRGGGVECGAPLCSKLHSATSAVAAR